MGQQMEFEETDHQQASQFENYETGYRDPFMASYGQKINPQAQNPTRSTSPWLRLILATLSLILLGLMVLLATVMLTIAHASLFALFGILLVMGIGCFTIIVINVAFNRHL